jgi:hypothetical protein
MSGVPGTINAKAICMSTLKTIEKQPFEELLALASGYVLDFTNATFAAFFREAVEIEIYDPKYAIYGDSKAKRLRAFWETEGDGIVGRILAELIELWEYKTPSPTERQKVVLARCREVAARLLGRQQTRADSEDHFLRQDLSAASFEKVRIDGNLIPILEDRFQEAGRCLVGDSPLATIFMCGSVLEGLLLGAALANPREFNQAPNSPKDAMGKVRPFHEWSLAQFIDVGCELGFLKLDIKKFGHALRDFRNYIHPYQQMCSGFSPDGHTAKICLQVLRAAIAGLSGERNP